MSHLDDLGCRWKNLEESFRDSGSQVSWRGPLEMTLDNVELTLYNAGRALTCPPPVMKTLLIHCLGGTLIFFAITNHAAQETTADQKLKQLQLEADIAKAQAEIATSRATQAQQEAARLAATFPTNKVTPLEGKTTVDAQYTFPPLLLAYSASDQMTANLASKIADAIQGRRNRSGRNRVLICQGNDSLVAQRAVYSQLNQRIGKLDTTLTAIEDEFTKTKMQIEELPNEKEAARKFVELAKNVLETTPTPAPRGSPGPPEERFFPGLVGFNEGLTAANSTLQTVIQLVSLFRTDTTITGTSITLDTDAIAAQLGNNLKRFHPSLIVEYPALMWEKDSLILRKFGQMNEKFDAISGHPLEIEMFLIVLGRREEIIEEQIKKQPSLGTPEETSKVFNLATGMAKDEHQGRTNRLNDLKRRFAALEISVGALAKGLQSADEKTGATALSTMAKAEALMNALDQSNTYSVLLKVVAGGGATRVDRNLFTGSKLRQLGGAVFVATLVDNKGTILLTNVSKGFLGYSNLKSTGGTIVNDIGTEPSAPTHR
jgi:hypothetical protein